MMILFSFAFELKIFVVVFILTSSWLAYLYASNRPALTATYF